MSYSFSLIIDRDCAKPDNREQTSPLVFADRKEAEGYADKIFWPPQSVLSYDIVKVATKPNSRFKNGKLEVI